MGWMRTASAPGAVAALSLLGSCSIMYGDDADAKQCKVQADCDAVSMRTGAQLVCNDGVCEQPADAGAQVVAKACTVDSECPANNRCGFDGFCYEKWGCIDQPRDFAPADTNADFRATVRRFENSASAELVGDLKAVACLTNSPSCNPPSVASEAIALSADKVLAVPFRGLAENGFVGAIEVMRRPSADGGTGDPILPAYYHFTSENPLVTNLTTQSELFMASDVIFPVLAGQWGVTLDPQRGTVVLQVHDCGGRKAADVTLTPMGVSDYLFAPVTGKSTPTLAASATTEDGAALLLNLPPDRNVIFTLRDEVQGRVLSDKISFVVRGKAINYFAYYPRRSALARWMAHAKAQGLTP